jgi:hypothetical protein
MTPVTTPCGASAFIREDTAAELGITPNAKLTRPVWDKCRLRDWERNREESRARSRG